MSTPSAVANAYANMARLSDPAGLAKGATESAAGPSFGELLKDAVGALDKSSHTAETQAQAMAAGKGNIVDVVTAVAETEVAVDALVAVRDKVIAAYEEIMKMPI